MATRRHHPLRTLLIVVLVLAGFLFAADRIGLAVAEHVAADKIRSTQGLSSTPDVNIGGFPFLTQLAGRSFDQITVTASDVPSTRRSAASTSPNSAPSCTP